MEFICTVCKTTLAKVLLSEHAEFTSDGWHSPEEPVKNKKETSWDFPLPLSKTLSQTSHPQKYETTTFCVLSSDRKVLQSAFPSLKIGYFCLKGKKEQEQDNFFFKKHLKYHFWKLYFVII